MTLIAAQQRKDDQDNHLGIKAAPAVLFEMLRSFTVLARNLNLSRTEAEIGVTRQTVRRHIDSLEQIKGIKLFRVVGRQYQLTAAGSHLVAEAEALLTKAAAWLSDYATNVDGLYCIELQMDGGRSFYAQQHPVSRIWSIGPPLLKKGLQIWTTSEARLDHRTMKKIQPYMVVYRKHNGDWVCVSVGERSSYATWLGQTWAMSAIGCSYKQDPINSHADHFMVRAYDTAFETGSVWYDHVCTKFPRHQGGQLHQVNYQRLIFSCAFPDGQPAVAALVARTNKIVIDGLPPREISKMPKADLMDFEI